MIEIIVNLHNYLVDFCQKYSKEHGDCYKCPIGQQIKEYCKIDGAIRFLDQIIRNYNVKKELKNQGFEVKDLGILKRTQISKEQINILDILPRKGDILIATTIAEKDQEKEDFEGDKNR